jgi:predicted cation transporter
MVVGLVIIALMVLVLPFRIKFIERNLELFFLAMGVIAVTVSGLWSVDLVVEALKAPVMIGSLPVGIFQIVLLFGLLIHFFYRQFSGAIIKMASKMRMSIFIFILLVALGLLSSIISVIVTAVLLVEIVAALPFSKPDRTRLIVIACYAVGLGAVLTPLGEPLSTILVQRLSGAPYLADFTFPFTHFAVYVIPGVVALAILGAVWVGRKVKVSQATAIPAYTESLRNVIMRAVRVFAFVAALVLLGEGLKPLIVWFFTRIPAFALYWINIISAVLDNATLTAVEVSGDMAISQIISIIMGLLIAGGMLIPGNIPNIVAAARLRISMKEWAVIGVPIGLILMAIYFGVLSPIIFN